MHILIAGGSLFIPGELNFKIHKIHETVNVLVNTLFSSLTSALLPQTNYFVCQNIELMNLLVSHPQFLGGQKMSDQHYKLFQYLPGPLKSQVGVGSNCVMDRWYIWVACNSGGRAGLLVSGRNCKRQLRNCFPLCDWLRLKRPRPVLAQTDEPSG